MEYDRESLHASKPVSRFTKSRARSRNRLSERPRTDAAPSKQWPPQCVAQTSHVSDPREGEELRAYHHQIQEHSPSSVLSAHKEKTSITLRPAQEIGATRVFNVATLSRHDELSYLSPNDQTTASDGGAQGYEAASTSSAELNNARLPEASRLLSTPENDAINSKVDRLVAAIEDRRGLRFVPSSEAGEYEIFADAVSDLAHSEADELELSISPWPQNFGRIIRPGEEYLAIRSPRSEIYDFYHDTYFPSSWSSNSTAEQNRGRATVHESFKGGSRQPSDVQNIIRGVVRYRSRQARQDGGQYLVRVGQAGVEQHRISPIPLDYDKALRVLTPSIHSNGSEQDCSSPLFGKSCETVPQEANDKPSTARYDRESKRWSTPDLAISTWLKEIHTPPLRTHRDDDISAREFGVFQDRAREYAVGWKARPKLPPISDALKDISNLRRPGYLAFNSFVRREKTVAQDDEQHIELRDTSRSMFRGSYGEHLAKSPTKVKQDRIRGMHRMNDISRISEQTRARNHQPTHERSTLRQVEQPLDPDPEKAYHLAFTLARLEGRIPPKTPSPVLRFVDHEGVYSSNVEMDSRTLHRRHPFPEKSFQLGELVERLEAAVLKQNEMEEKA